MWSDRSQDMGSREERQVADLPGAFALMSEEDLPLTANDGWSRYTGKIELLPLRRMIAKLRPERKAPRYHPIFRLSAARG
jgi:hypothetical protein